MWRVGCKFVCTMYQTLCPAHAPRPHKISDLCSKMVNFVHTIIEHLVKYFQNLSTLVSDLTPNCQGSSLAASELLFSTPEHVEMNQFIFGQLCHQVWCPNNNNFWKNIFQTKLVVVQIRQPLSEPPMPTILFWEIGMAVFSLINFLGNKKFCN